VVEPVVDPGEDLVDPVDQIAMNSSMALNFMRSATAPAIYAGVIMAKVS